MRRQGQLFGVLGQLQSHTSAELRHTLGDDPLVAPASQLVPAITQPGFVATITSAGWTEGLVVFQEGSTIVLMIPG